MKTMGFLLLFGCASVGWAQEPAFDVASVKVWAEQTGGRWNLSPPGQVMFSGTRLSLIVGLAFEVPIPVQELRVVWPPALDALRIQRFEILAKGDPQHASVAMLRTLLKERFGLKTHTETRTVPVYALKVRDPRQLKLRSTPHNCRQFVAAGGRRGSAESPRDGSREICFGAELGVRRSASTIAEFIEQIVISGMAGELPVVDATGLSGNFLWEIRGNVLSGPGFTDMLADVGLKVERTTGPWEVIVVDHVQMPTPN